MEILRRMTAIFLLFALAGPAAAAGPAPSGLEAAVDGLREEYGLDERNFSLCYRDTVTGEEYRFNDTAFFLAGSTFKLPLNLYYYEMERDGTLDPSSCVGGVTLSKAHYQSLVWSDNDVSKSMLYNLGNFRTYKEKMRKYFTMDDAEIPYSYYTDNYYCTAMMLDALQYLYDRREAFSEMLDYMSQAQPGEYFARYAGETAVAHKYGFFYDGETNVGVVNDVGVIYGPHPFLLAVYTQNVGDGEKLLGRICERLLQYNEERYAGPEPGSEPEPEPIPAPRTVPAAGPEPEPEPAPEPASESEPGPDDTPEAVVRRNIWWMVLVAAGIFLLADVGALFWMRHGGIERMEEKWGDGEDEEEEETPQPPEADPPGRPE